MHFCPSDSIFFSAAFSVFLFLLLFFIVPLQDVCFTLGPFQLSIIGGTDIREVECEGGRARSMCSALVGVLLLSHVSVYGCVWHFLASISSPSCFWRPKKKERKRKRKCRICTFVQQILCSARNTLNGNLCVRIFWCQNIFFGFVFYCWGGFLQSFFCGTKFIQEIFDMMNCRCSHRKSFSAVCMEYHYENSTCFIQK